MDPARVSYQPISHRVQLARLIIVPLDTFWVQRVGENGTGGGCRRYAIAAAMSATWLVNGDAGRLSQVDHVTHVVRIVLLVADAAC